MAEKGQTKVLRIGIVHEGRIIEERLIRKRVDVTVGASPKCTFVLPIANLPESYRLFIVEKGRYLLRFTAGMSGRLSVGDRLWDLAELRESTLVRRSGQYYLLPLDDASRGRLVFGEVSLLFQFVVPPPPVPKLELPAAAKGGVLSRIDTPLFLALIASTIIQVGGVGGIQYWWYSVGQFQVAKSRPRLEAFEFLKAEVQRRPKVTVTKVPGEGSGVGEGTGQAEGEAKQEQRVARRPQRSAGTGESPEERYRRKLAEVRSRTALRFLGPPGSGADAIVGPGVEDGAAAQRERAAWEMKGGVEVSAAGALLSGFRAVPGGGVSGEGTTYEKLDKEEIGSRRVVAQVAGGTKAEEVKISVSIADRPEKMIGAGRLETDQIHVALQRRQGVIRACYEERMRFNEGLEGKVSVQFTIGVAGTVVEAEIVANATGDVELGRCIVQVLRKIRFPPPEGGTLTVRYPFVFKKG